MVKLTHKEIVRAIQYLSPAYQTVCNLFGIGGFGYDEIAEKPGISVGTSDSNLFGARKRLQKILLKQNKISLEIGICVDGEKRASGGKSKDF